MDKEQSYSQQQQDSSKLADAAKRSIKSGATSHKGRSNDYLTQNPNQNPAQALSNQSQQKSSQISISISVHNQSMRDGANLRNVGASQSNDKLREVFSSKVVGSGLPINLGKLDNEGNATPKLKSKIKKSPRNELNTQTLSMSAGQLKSGMESKTDIHQSQSQHVTKESKHSDDQSSKNPNVAIQSQYTAEQQQHFSQFDDGINPILTTNPLLDVNMSVDAKSRIVVRPLSELKKRGQRGQSGRKTNQQADVRVRKKRVKSVRPGGIRGGVLIQDRFAAMTPMSSNKKLRQGSLRKLGIQADMSSDAYVQQSTKAGMSSMHQYDSMLYRSYAPTQLIKVGTQSVQRLKPRMQSAYGGSQINARPITAAAIPKRGRPNQLGSDYDEITNSFTQFNSQATPAMRPQSQVHYSRANQNKFSSMKAAAMRGDISSGQFMSNAGLLKKQTTEPNIAQTGQRDLNQAQELLQHDDGFKLISQFESEQQALEYATELQKYYDGLNMDVKVQIETNLAHLDDTDNQQYMNEAFQNYKQDLIQQLEDEQEQSIFTQQQVAKTNVRQAYSSHFQKIDPIKIRQAKLTEQAKEKDRQETRKLMQKRGANNNSITNPSVAEPITYNKLNKNQIKELYQAQDHIFGVIQDTAKLPQLSQSNVWAHQRHERTPHLIFDKEVKKSQIKHSAQLQANILAKLGILPQQLQGEVPHASQVMSSDNKIPKSRAKFHQREQRLKKLFDDQVKQWQREAPQMNQSATQSSIITQSDPAQVPFEVDVRLYKERGDTHPIIGNKLQYRACEQAVDGQNYVHRQAMQTKGNFDPIRIRLRIMPISRAPLAQGKTPDYYFREAAKKSLSGDLTSAIELLKRGLIINPNHFICRFNHGVLMFKFGLIGQAMKDFESLTTNRSGCKDPWVFFNLATCLIQINYPEKPLYEQQKEKMLRKKALIQQANLQKQLMQRLTTSPSFIDTLTNIQDTLMSDMVTAQETILAKPDKGIDNYSKAIEMCDKAYQLGGHDKEIMLDSLNLKGICLFRLGELIESVKVLSKARVLQKRIEDEIEERRRAREKKEVDEVMGFFTRADYKLIYKKRSGSFHFTNHVQISKPRQRLLPRDQSWQNFELNEKLKLEQLAEDEWLAQSSQSSEQKENVDEQAESPTDPSSRDKSPMSDVSKASRALNEIKQDVTKQLQSSNKALVVYPQTSERSGSPYKHSAHSTSRERSNASTFKKSRPSHLLGSPRKEQDSQKQSIKSSTGISVESLVKPTADNTKSVKFNQNSDEPNKAQKAQKALKVNLLNSLVKRMTNMQRQMKASVTRNMDDNKITSLMQKMQKKKELLAQDRANLRMSKAQYSIFRKEYLEHRKKSDAVVDEENPLLRLKNIYLRQFDEFEEEYEDCNMLEQQELRKRKAILQWIGEDDLITKLIAEEANKLSKMVEVGVDPVDSALNAKFVKKLLKVAAVKLEEVDGSHIENILDIIEDQSQMDGIMLNLRERVTEMCRLFEKELTRGENELTCKVPKLDEIKILRGERHIDVEDQTHGHEDKMITRLRDCLNNDLSTPDEVVSVLTTDKFEKEKVKLQLQQINGGSDDEQCDEDKIYLKRKQIAIKSKNKHKARSDMRYTERHIQMINYHFSVPQVDRNYKDIDFLMRHLRYLKRHEPEVRKQIYKYSQFCVVPAQTVIFNKGDEADYMYIILKGRVSCLSTLSHYKDIEINLATVTDGEAFGELALINSDRVIINDSQDDKRHDIQYPRRAATCRTVENTRMIRIQASEANRIIQPTLKKEQEFSTMSAPQSRDQSMTLETLNNSVDGIPSEVKDYQADDLSQRLNFLQSFGLFKDIKPSKVLLPVAINMSIIKFKYGEFLTRVGDRPAGMYLIKSGQCIVGLSRTAKRDKHWRDIPGHREPINDKLELFNKFDAENTLLNNVEIQDRVFQNGRIYVEDDKQIRDKILYHDFVQFSKLFPKRQFGGRCLLPFEMYMQLKRIYFGPESLKKPGNEPVTDMRSEEEYQMKSFLDIVADSAVVEVYMITKQGLQYLNDHYMKNIYESIVQEKEPDRPYHEEKINEKKAEMIHDQEEHLKTVKNIMKANKIAKYGVMAIKDQS